MSEKTIYYQTNDFKQESMRDDMDECIENYLAHVKEFGDKLPSEIIVEEYETMKPDVEFLSRMVIDGLVEKLDEDYGAEADYTTPSEMMKAESTKFVKKILSMYHVWACEPNGKTHKIDCKQWVTEYNPGWIEDDGVEFEGD